VAWTWEAMVAGRSGVVALADGWAAQLPVRIAARLKVEPAEIIDRVRLRRLDRCEAVALIAAHQAWADAGLAGAVDAERLAVVVGSGIGGATTLLNQDDILEESGPRKVSPHTVPMLMPNGPAAWVGLELGARAGVHAPVSACATGAEAIAWGLDALRAGAGMTSDGYDIVQPDPQGRGTVRAIRAALRDADVDPHDIRHVNAHATATPVGDIAEIAALRHAEVTNAVITSTKSMTGHLLGAAGAVESIATILALHYGVVPPTINLEDPDDALDLDVAALRARELDIPAALNDSFGFGGHNAVLVFKIG